MELIWPFPQLIQVTGQDLLYHRSTVDATDRLLRIEANWDLSFLWGELHSVIGLGNRLEIADFDQWFLLSNGTRLFLYDAFEETFDISTSSATMPGMSTICAFKGQVVGGGITSSWHGCDSGSVVWSDIGSASFTPTRSNEAGFRSMGKVGEVYRVRRLGDVVMVYGSKGIAALVPASAPVPTFGLREMLPVGIVSRYAVEGDEHLHTFVDRSGWVWQLSEDMALKRLGYQEFMLKLTANEIVVTQDQTENDFYISDSKRCFLLSPSGLTEVGQLVLGVGLVNGERAGVFKDSGRRDLSFTTDTLDFDLRGRKTIFSAEFGLDGCDKALAAIQWKSDKVKDFVQTPWTDVNKEGQASKVITGTDFRVCFQAPNYIGAQVDYMKLRWKITDLRNVRGLYDATPKGSS